MNGTVLDASRVGQKDMAKKSTVFTTINKQTNNIGVSLILGP